MKIIFDIRGKNEIGGDYGYVDVNIQCIEDIRKRIQLAKQLFALDGRLARVLFFDYMVLFNHTTEIEELMEPYQEQFDKLSDLGFFFVDDDFEIPEDSVERSEVHRMHLVPPCINPHESLQDEEWEIFWSAIIKHTDIELATCDIKFVDILNRQKELV